MTSVHETLSTFAEIAVALAGFSGIVIAFGRRSQGAATKLELRRLANLFTWSGFVLLVSLFGIVLDGAGVSDVTLWRALSVVVLLFAIPWMLLDARKVSQFDAAERARMSPFMTRGFDAAAVLVLLAQIYNVVALGQSWPLLIALVVAVAFAFQQFMVLVRTGFDGN